MGLLTCRVIVDNEDRTFPDIWSADVIEGHLVIVSTDRTVAAFAPGHWRSFTTEPATDASEKRLASVP